VTQRNLEAFENVKTQIGLCGIWCGSCTVGNGTLSALATGLEELVSSYGLKEWAEGFDHLEFSRGLAAIRRASSCCGCLKGGGREKCEIRACATHEQLPGCTACGKRSRCSHAAMLGQMRTGARRAGLAVLEKESDRNGAIAKWMTELTSRWPACVLFAEDFVQPEREG
jgi:hypothetical protein